MYEIFEQLLQKFGVTSYKVCKDTGISQSTVSTWKTKNTKIGSENAEVLARYFGVSIDYLMGVDTSEEVEVETEVQKRVKIMTRKAEEHLTKEERERLIKLYFDSIDMYLEAKGIHIDD